MLGQLGTPKDFVPNWQEDFNVGHK